MSRPNANLFAAVRAKHVYAEDRLKEKFPGAVPVDDIISFVFNALEREDVALIKRFESVMAASSKVAYDSVKKTYRYKPPYPIRSPDELISYFQNQSHTRSINVQDLKQGWAECDVAINQLEKEHKLIVIRNKKDQTPKSVWADDPALSAPADPQFVDFFNSIELLPKDDIVRFLEKCGRTPAGQVAANKNLGANKAKPRKSRQSTKQTNVHMKGLFKDYSGLRQKGK